MRFPLLFVLAAAVLSGQALVEVRGTATDPAGAGVRGAAIELRSPAGTVACRTTSGERGEFRCASVPRGSYRLRISAAGFADTEQALLAGRDEPSPVLQIAPLRTSVSVTATRGGVEDAATSAHLLVAVNDTAALLQSTLGNALENSPAILVQQTTTAQVSPFLRGLTGYQVLNLVDGVRFNNSTFRSGPNQYLAFIEPSQAQRVEAMLGPNGAQYGSDALGGTISVITPEARFGDDGWETHGEIAALASSADAAGGSFARVGAGTPRFATVLGASGRRHNDLRAGGGWDSRNAFHRYFGLSGGQIEDIAGNRQQDTGFTQYGLFAKAAARIRDDQSLSLWYQRGEQRGVRNYKDLLGGLGRMESAVTPQVLDFFYARYEKLGLGPLETLSGTFSLNSQRDGSVRQGLLATDSITRDDVRVDAWGYATQASVRWRQRVSAVFGAEYYDERIDAVRFVDNPVTGARQSPRPLYPDGSAYRTLGAFAQGGIDLPHRLRLGAGLRFTRVGFETRREAALNIPASSQSFRDLTYNGSVSWQATARFGLHALVGRGFRAPNLNDLGAIGLNDLGYEVPSAEAIAAGALLSTSSGEGATSRGTALRSLRAESLMNYELGVRFTAGRLYARVQAFDSELTDPIVRRTLLFPADRVPASVAGLAVTPNPQTAAQKAEGVVTVAPPFDARALKSFVNDGASRYWGVESLLRYEISNRWHAQANYSYLLGRDLDPNRNIRRLPPQAGSATLRWFPGWRRMWTEAVLSASGAQERLSGGDIDDERIGASRSRRDIASFFAGTRAGALRADGLFAPTSETLRQIQDRVLPLGATINGVLVRDDSTRVPLYLDTAGWVTVGLRVGVPLAERWQVNLGLENLLDRNYRVHGSGVDAPGRGLRASLRYSF